MMLLVVCGLAAVFIAEAGFASSFLPDEDQGYVYASLQLPVAASMERTSAAAAEVEKVLAATPGVEYATTVAGFNLLSFAQTTYNAFFFITFKPWDARKTRDGAVSGHQKPPEPRTRQVARGNCVHLLAGLLWIPGVGTSGGFQFVLEDRAGKKDVPYLADNLNKFPGSRAEAARKSRSAHHHVSTQCAAAIPPGGPRQSAEARCRLNRRLSDHSGLHGRSVR